MTENQTYLINTNEFSRLIPRYSRDLEDNMPNIRGASLRDALNIISPVVSKYNAQIAIEGEGYIVNFLPNEGEEITNNQIVYLYLEP